MKKFDAITQKAYGYAAQYLEKNNELKITWPKPGSAPANVLYGPSGTGGLYTVTFSGIHGGWGKTVITEDGFKQIDARHGKAIIVNDTFTAACGTGTALVSVVYLTFRQIVAKPGVQVYFDNIPVNIVVVTDDPRCDTFTVEFVRDQ